MAPVAPELRSPQRSPSSSADSSSSSRLKPSASSPPLIAKKQQRKLPIIRVVHVFAPTLIKTDTANFRTLVQELTGNKARLDLKEEIEAHIRNACSAVKQPLDETDHHDGLDCDEELRIPGSSKITKKKGECRTSSCSRYFETGYKQMKEPRLAQDLEDPSLRDGLDGIMNSSCSRAQVVNKHGDSDNDWMVTSFSDGVEQTANFGNCFELEGRDENRIGGFFASENADTDYGSMRFGSCLKSSNSSCNTYLESPSSPLQGMVDAIDERLHGFHHSNAPHHFNVQFDNYQTLLNSFW